MTHPIPCLCDECENQKFEMQSLRTENAALTVQLEESQTEQNSLRTYCDHGDEENNKLLEENTSLKAKLGYALMSLDEIKNMSITSERDQREKGVFRDWKDIAREALKRLDDATKTLEMCRPEFSSAIYGTWFRAMKRIKGETE